MLTRLGNRTARRFRVTLRRVRDDGRGLALVEFALAMPLVLGLALAGIEFANYVLAVQKSQRLATMMADIVAQSSVGINEVQIDDLFNAIDLSAQPLPLNEHGRIIVTLVEGVRSDPNDRDSEPTNFNRWQRCAGQLSLTDSERLVGEEGDMDAPLANDQQLAVGETVVHAQVTYEYQPVIGIDIWGYFSGEGQITRYAMFRPRKLGFNTITPVQGFTPRPC